MFRGECSVYVVTLQIGDTFLGLVDCLTALTAEDGEEEKALKEEVGDWRASTPSASVCCGPFVSCSYSVILCLI